MKRSSKETDLMKHNTQHQRQDYAVEDYMDNVVEIYMDNAVDAYMENAGIAVKVDTENAVEVYMDNAVENSTENAEVGNEVQGGGDFINVRIEIYSKAEERPTGGLHNILRFDFEDISVQAEFYNYIYKEVVSQPTTKKGMVVKSRKAQYKAVLSACGEDMFNTPRSLSRVSAWGEDMFNTPLSLSRVSVTEDSSVYGDREEVLAELGELGEQLKVFPPTQRQMKYAVAEEKGVAKYIVRIELKDKEDKLNRRSEESFKMQRTRIFQLLSWGCIGWQQAPPIVF